MMLFTPPFRYGVALLIALSVWSPAPAQAQLDDDDFFERGRDWIESEIDRLEAPPLEINLESKPKETQPELPAANWHQLVVTEGAQFTIAVPGPPQTYDEVAIETPDGSLDFVGWLASHRDSQFIVAYGEYPTPTPRPSERLMKLRDRMVTDTGWTLAEDASEPLGSHPGRRFILFNPAQMITYRFYLVDERLYILGVLQEPTAEVEAEADRFFESFELLPPGTTVEDILPPGSVPE